MAMVRGYELSIDGETCVFGMWNVINGFQTAKVGGSSVVVGEYLDCDGEMYVNDRASIFIKGGGEGFYFMSALNVDTDGMLCDCECDEVLETYGFETCSISKGTFASKSDPLGNVREYVTGNVTEMREEEVQVPYLNDDDEIMYKGVMLKVVEVTEK